MIRFFNSTQPATIIVIPLIVLALWAQSAGHMSVVVDDSSMPLWNFLAGGLRHLPPFVLFLLMSALISFEAIYLNLVMNRNEVLYRDSFLPALCFALVVSCSNDMLVVHPVHFANLLFIRVLDNTFSLFKNDQPVSALFDCSFLLAVAALLYFPALPVYLLIVIAVNLMRAFNWREFWILVAGFFLPFFYINVYYFITGGLFRFWESYFLKFSMLWPEWGSIITVPLQVLAWVFGGLLFLSLYILRKNFYKNVIRTRTYQQIIFFFLVFGAGSLFLANIIRTVHLIMLAIPVSVFYAYYFLSGKRRKWITELVMWIFVGAVLVNHFF